MTVDAIGLLVMSSLGFSVVGAPDGVGVIAAADGLFVTAAAEVKGNKLYMQAASVATPKAVRFDWSNDPEYYIINKAGLPASPFVLSLE